MTRIRIVVILLLVGSGIGACKSESEKSSKSSTSSAEEQSAKKPPAARTGARTSSKKAPALAPRDIEWADASPVRALALGGAHTCALSDAGVLCWGANDVGQLGTESLGPTCRTPDYRDHCAKRPARVALPPDAQGSSLSAGTATTCVVVSRKDDELASVSCWGAGALGYPAAMKCALGLSQVGCSPIPDAVRGVESPIRVAVGGSHACVIDVDEHLHCWGVGGRGQLGVADVEHTERAVPVDELSSVQQVAVGDEHTCVIRGDRTAWCFGANAEGQLGDGDDVDRSRPARVEGLGDVSAIAAGARHTCAVTPTGQLQCWGANRRGQLGDGSFVEKANAVRVEFDGRAVHAVALGSAHTCALHEDATVSCWGANDKGQLGIGTLDDSPTPVRVGGLTDVRTLGAGDAHTCAVVGDGEVRCWGSNRAFQLAHPTGEPRPRPTAIQWRDQPDESGASTDETEPSSDRERQ